MKTLVEVTISEGDKTYNGKFINRAKRATVGARPGWGQVYNYGNMHNDLDTNDATDGEFESDVCTHYYDYLEDLEDYLEDLEEAYY